MRRGQKGHGRVFCRCLAQASLCISLHVSLLACLLACSSTHPTPLALLPSSPHVPLPHTRRLVRDLQKIDEEVEFKRRQLGAARKNSLFEVWKKARDRLSVVKELRKKHKQVRGEGGGRRERRWWDGSGPYCPVAAVPRTVASLQDKLPPNWHDDMLKPLNPLSLPPYPLLAAGQAAPRREPRDPSQRERRAAAGRGRGSCPEAGEQCGCVEGGWEPLCQREAGRAVPGGEGGGRGDAAAGGGGGGEGRRR